MQGRLKTLNLASGSASFETQGSFAYDFTVIKDNLGFGDAFAYLRSLIFKYVFTITKSDAGAVTVTWPKLYDVLTGCYFKLESFDREVIGLTLSAGQTLWILAYLKNRCLPVVQTNLAVAGTGAASANVALMIPIDFFDLRSREPEDGMIYTQLLDGSQIQFTWNSQGFTNGVSSTFGTTSFVTTVTPATLTANVVPRDEQRTPTLIHLTEQPAVATQGENLNLGGTYPIDLHMIPVHSQSPTAQTFSAANVTTVLLTVDSVNRLDSVQASAIVDRWQDEFSASGDRPPQWEAGGSHVLPLIQELAPSNGKKSKIKFVKGKPVLTLGGTITTAIYRYMIQTVWPIDRNAAAAAFGKVGIPVNPADLISKTTSKTAQNVPQASNLLPWKIPGPSPSGGAKKAA